jgi:hypothetical protein
VGPALGRDCGYAIRAREFLLGTVHIHGWRMDLKTGHYTVHEANGVGYILRAVGLLGGCGEWAYTTWCR